MGMGFKIWHRFNGEFSSGTSRVGSAWRFRGTRGAAMKTIDVGLSSSTGDSIFSTTSVFTSFFLSFLRIVLRNGLREQLAKKIAFQSSSQK
jgi:hypothetical protein